MPLRIVFTLFLLMGAFEIYSQVYLGSGNLELISTDASKGKFIVRLRFFSAVNNFEPGTDVIRIYSNSNGKIVRQLPGLGLLNYPTTAEIISNSLPNLRCDSNLINNQVYPFLLQGSPFSKEGIYEDTLTLDPNIYTDPQGYTLTTRSNDTYSPSAEYANFLGKTPPIPPIVVGIPAKPTMVLKIPPLKDANGTIFKNSSPEFSTYKQEYLCRGRPFSMIVGCKDADNDELRYSLVHPYAAFVPDGLLTTLSDLQLQAFKPGYSMSNLIDGSISIDTKSGLLSLLPSKWGTYLVGVKVEQIRSGKVIGFTYKYYSFMVRECKKPDDPQPKLTPTGYPTGTNDITVCKGQPITLNSQSNPNWVYEWSKDGFVIQGETSPTLTIVDEGIYEVKVRVKYPINNNNIEEGCSNINKERINITILGAVGSVKLGGQKTFCNGGLTTLTAPIKTNIAYQWYKDGVAIVGANTAVYDVNKVGKYFVTLTDVTSPLCPSNSDTLDVTLSANPPKIDILSDGAKKQLCPEGGQIALKSNATANQAVKWFKNGVEIAGQNLADYITTQAGEFTFELSDNTTKCIVQSNPFKIIVGSKPVASITSQGNTKVICENTQLILNTNNLPNGKYQWQFNGADISGATQQNYSADAKGDYTVSVVDSNDCKNTSQAFSLDIVNKIIVKLDPITEMCADAKSVSLIGFPANGTYSGTGVQNGNFDPKISGAGTFKISYSITTGMLCQQGKAEQTVIVNTLPKSNSLPNSIFVNKGSTVMLNSGSLAGYTYQWTPALYLDSDKKGNPISKPDKDIEYVVKIISDKGCTAEGKIKVKVDSKILIPTAFTPNNDGMNDTWEIFGIENFPESEVYIYNRWGELVFYSKGYSNPFDGRYNNGVDLPVGGYAYKINVIRPSEGGYEMKGAVTILR